MKIKITPENYMPHINCPGIKNVYDMQKSFMKQ